MNNSSKKETKSAKASASRPKKAQASAPKSPRYTTWLKYVAMLIGVVGVVFIMLGTYGTFRALIHQMHVRDLVENEAKLPSRAPDGSRVTVEKNPEDAKKVREALSAAEHTAKTPNTVKRVDKTPDVPHESGAPIQQEASPAIPSLPVPTTPMSTSAITDANHPKMVIVIDDIGESIDAVRALLSLDFPVTFAIWPHATHTKKAAMLIYSEGKEIILHQPMQALNDKVNPGLGALYVGMSAEKIRDILQANLAKVPHAVGLNNHMGSRFTEDRDGILTVCDLLKERGLFALDSLTHADSIFYAEAQKKGLKSARRNVFLDAVSGEKNVLFELNRVEGIAKKQGLGIAIGHPFATTISGLKAWSKNRDKSIAIVRLADIVR